MKASPGGVLRDIVPGKGERDEVEALCRDVVSAARRICGVAKPLICGSVAKDTWLSGRGEVDLFLLFSDDVKKDRLKKLGLEYGKKIVKELKGSFVIAYAEHPYVRAIIKGRKVDIVPAYDTDPADIKSSVDRTPHHLAYVRKRLNGLNDDVRLFKQFCLSLGMYGSDLKTRGLSGYLCELLVIHYGGFGKLAKASLTWRAGESIDPAGHYSGGKKFPEPFVVVDPVDRDRNVASVLSEENFFLLRKTLREFAKKPSARFFSSPGQLSAGEIKRALGKRKTYPILLSFTAPPLIDDILWPQLRKGSRRLAGGLSRNGFTVIRADVWSGGRSFILLEMERGEVGSVEKKRGPLVADKKNSEAFINAHRKQKVYVEEGRLFVESKKKFTDAEGLLGHLLSKKEMKNAGLPSAMAKARGFSIAGGKKFYRRIKGLEEFLTGYLQRYVS